MITEFLFFLINVLLLLFLIYREKQFGKLLRAVLASKLSRDVSEFQIATTEEKKEEKETRQEVEIPLEDVPAEELLGAIDKK